ncbi:TPA: hypothetical protein QDE50_21880 [Burkholderia cenocepacia]|uniref:Uncharacterized protein n=1 Tax=Burkholderia latens TaxID=488446 RepID=A0A6P2I474_9BURK|nr:hypothetical protein BLA24064_00996 [Burkholderia latens]HDR9879692.1 hypothetical protein [Burkholderia cenocepacia]HDR9886781.1 hypothetical protein [Burkholderia cenocepacia]
MQVKGTSKDAVLREGMLYFLQESTKRVLSQFASGQLLDDVDGAYSGGLIGGFYGGQAAVAQLGRRRMRERIGALRSIRSRREYRRMILTIYCLGVQHGRAIRRGEVLPT